MENEPVQTNKDDLSTQVLKKEISKNVEVKKKLIVRTGCVSGIEDEPKNENDHANIEIANDIVFYINKLWDKLESHKIKVVEDEYDKTCGVTMINGDKKKKINGGIGTDVNFWLVVKDFYGIKN